MGQLLFVSNIDNAPWYFKDSYYNSETRKFGFPWPNDSYPFPVSIPESHAVKAEAKSRIRSWIELNLPETVIYSVVDNSYHVYYGEDHSYNNAYTRRNTWLVFHFDNEHSALVFSLAFADLVKPITKHHPDCPEDEAWCNRKRGEN